MQYFTSILSPFSTGTTKKIPININFLMKPSIVQLYSLFVSIFDWIEYSHTANKNRKKNSPIILDALQLLIFRYELPVFTYERTE